MKVVARHFDARGSTCESNLVPNPSCCPSGAYHDTLDHVNEVVGQAREVGKSYWRCSIATRHLERGLLGTHQENPHIAAACSDGASTDRVDAQKLHQH